MNEQAENTSVDNGDASGRRATLWKPGQSGNPAGRPAGSRDKKWASLDYWFGLVENEWEAIKPETRVKVAIEAWKALLARKQVSTPEESVTNTEATMRMLKMLQDMSRGIKPSVGAISGTDGMGDGRSTPQAEGPATPGV